MLDMAHVVASRGLFGTSYDNINMVFGAAEQLVGRTGQFYNEYLRRLLSYADF